MALLSFTDKKENASKNPVSVLPDSDLSLSVKSGDKPTTQKIVPLPRVNVAAKGKTDSVDKDFQFRVDTFTPLCGKLFSIADNGGVKFIRLLAKDAIEKNEIDVLCKAVEMGQKSCDIAGNSLARILAKRIENEDVLDYLVIGGVLVEWGAGITLAVREIQAAKKPAIGLRREAVSS